MKAHKQLLAWLPVVFSKLLQTYQNLSSIDGFRHLPFFLQYSSIFPAWSQNVIAADQD